MYKTIFNFVIKDYLINKMLNTIKCIFKNIRKHGLKVYISSLLSEDLDYIDVEDYDYSVNVPIGKKITIYGFGPYGKCALLDFFSKNEIVNIFDINYKKIGLNISSPDMIAPEQFDYIILTVMNEKAVNAVKDFLYKKNIPDNKIINVIYR